MKLNMVISICVNKEGYTLYHFTYCPPSNKYCCFSILIALRFEIIDRFRKNRGRVVLSSIHLKYGLRTRNSFEIRTGSTLD